MPSQLMFLAWGSPWPPQSGGALRTWGLLRELSRAFEIELIVLSQAPLSEEQTGMLEKYVCSIIRVPMKTTTLRDKLWILARMFTRLLPYHCASLDVSFQDAPGVLQRVRHSPDVIYASYGHWGTLVRDQKAANWILDQHNADVDFWRVYASQTSNLLLKLAAWVNWRLADKHFRRIYASVGHIISVCEEDKRLTLDLAPKAKIDVIQNGVDCSYYVPDIIPRTGSPRVLFTGTSAPRNVTALRQFVRNVLPLIWRELPEAELLVAGNFSPQAQAEFKTYDNVRFTGWVEDIRPSFNRSDVFIGPFEETHGSKLKIAEAMAMGMAIVSTPKGIRGFPLVNGESVLIAHSDEQFASQVVRLLTDPVMQERLGAAAREVALSTIDWKMLSKRLIGIVQLAQRCVQCNGNVKRGS